MIPEPCGKKECALDMRLELIPLPSTDVDRSKAFYAERVGFHVDHDVEPGHGMRVVQLTPPGSACSIVIGVGISQGVLADAPFRSEIGGCGRPG